MNGLLYVTVEFDPSSVRGRVQILDGHGVLTEELDSAAEHGWITFLSHFPPATGGIFATNVLRPERKRVNHLYPLLVRGSTEQDGDVRRFRVLLSALSSGSDTRFGGETCGMCIFTLSLSTERVSHVRRVFSLHGLFRVGKSLCQRRCYCIVHY